MKGAIRAVAVAQTESYKHQRPFAARIGGQQWKSEGWRVDAVYELLPNPTPVLPFASELMKLLPEKYSPLNRNGAGNQGYLFELPPRAANLLLERIGQATMPADAIIAKAVERLPPTATQKEQVILSRIGQGQFRADLLKMWGGQCCVTGLARTELLRASHIKPWRDSNNQERLDSYNGLLLSPAYTEMSLCVSGPQE